MKSSYLNFIRLLTPNNINVKNKVAKKCVEYNKYTCNINTLKKKTNK